MSAAVHESVALEDGRWERRGFIMVWRPAPELRVVSDPVGFNLNLIACGACGATVTQACRTPSGSRTRPHTARLVSRRCVCGEVVGNKAWFCDACRLRRRRETKRRSNQRAWAARHAPTNLATAKAFQAERWDNESGPNRVVSATQPGPNRTALLQKESGQ